MTELNPNPAAAQQVRIRLRAILDLFDDTDIIAGIRLLDEGSRATLAGHVRAVRPDEGLFLTRTGRVITWDEIEGWVDEAERGYDVGQLHLPGHVGSGHTYDGPADCPRCQLIRENQGWMEHALEPHAHSHAGNDLTREPHSHLHTHMTGPTPEQHSHEHRHAERT